MSGPTRVVVTRDRFELAVTTMVSVMHASPEEEGQHQDKHQARLRPHATRLGKLVAATLRRYRDQPDALSLVSLSTPKGPATDAAALIDGSALETPGDATVTPQRIAYRIPLELADEEVEVEVQVQVERTVEHGAVAGLGRILCRLLGADPARFVERPPEPASHQVWPVTSASPRVLVEARWRQLAHGADEAARLHLELKTSAARVRSAIEHELAETQRQSPLALTFPAEETPEAPSAGTVAGFRFSLTGPERELLVAIRCQEPGRAAAAQLRSGIRRFTRKMFARVREISPGEEVEPEAGWLLCFEDDREDPA